MQAKKSLRPFATAHFFHIFSLSRHKDRSLPSPAINGIKFTLTFKFSIWCSLIMTLIMLLSFNKTLLKYTSYYLRNSIKGNGNYVTLCLFVCNKIYLKRPWNTYKHTQRNQIVFHSRFCISCLGMAVYELRLLILCYCSSCLGGECNITLWYNSC